MRTLLILCGLFLTSTNLAANAVFKVSSVPFPAIKKNNYVSDPNHLLKDNTVQYVNKQLKALEQLTTDQVVVVILPSIGDEVAKDFARDLLVRFGIGQQDKGNGLVVLLVLDKQSIDFKAGYGLQGVLTDVICQRIETNYMSHRFKEGNYDQGIINGVHAVIQTLTSTEFRTQIGQEKEVHNANMTSVEIGKILIVTMAIPYGIFIFILFFIKRNKGSFIEKFSRVNRNKQKKITLTIPTWKWLFIYVVIPFSFLAFMYNYAGLYYLGILFVGMYAIILLALIDRKDRCVIEYKISFEKGDYYTQYNNHLKYFDDWGLASIFFPVPFLYTDWNNKQRLQAIRKHDRGCDLCGSQMILLDESSEDHYLKATQILEEQIKSVNYDVWKCTSCYAHQALAYYTKTSQYSACPHCGTKAYYLVSDIVKVTATYDHAGEGEKSYCCLYCKREQLEPYVIAQYALSSRNVSGGGLS